MSDWLNLAIDRGAAVDDWLAPQRSKSLELLRSESWPTRKTEAWKYTSVRAIERMQLAAVDTLVSSDVPSVVSGDVELSTDLNSIDILFIDGVLQADLSSVEYPAGLTIFPLDKTSGEARKWVADFFASIKPERHFFGLVNDVLAVNGLVIDVDKDADIERPIRIINRFSEGVEAHTRVLVRLAEGAKATVIEQFQGSEQSMNTSFAEYLVGEDAQLEHYRFALQTGRAISVGGCHFHLQQRASMNHNLLGFGSDLSRVDIDVTHGGEFARAKLNAIYLLDGNELFDLHSTIEHVAANGITEENIRGIVAGKAHAVFSGRIHIHRDAQKTVAELNNRNLLMSDGAQINTKPELEIYADDVRCAHGATVAEINRESLNYMQSRGIGRRQAQIMLSFGFINELVDQIPNEALADWLRPLLRQRFAQMEQVSQ